jgi:vacuolar iron transporter family protein
MPPRTDVWLENLQDERDGASLYEGLAQIEKDPRRRTSFLELARGERRHAEIWARKLTEAGVGFPEERSSRRTRLLLWMARRVGTQAVLPLVIQGEVGDADKYLRQGGRTASALAEEEKDHRVKLAEMEPAAPSGPRAAIAVRENWHRGGRGGAIRAAIFGMNDGIVSNLSLVLGVAGAGVGARGLLLTGIAGLLAGASSMAVGEYTSVASQRDLMKRQIDLERREIAEAPEEETAELALILEQKGLPAEQATRAAAEIMKNPEHGLDTLVREELGLDPNDLGAPALAAVSSFIMFAIGAMVPLAPFFFAAGTPAVVASAACAMLVLAVVGSFIGVLSGTGAWRSGGRMVLLAAAAAAVTFGLGRLVGSVVG